MRADGQIRDANVIPLIMLPGTLCDARIFGPLRDRLAGYESEVRLTPDAQSLEQAAEEVLANAPQEFVLLGFSLGGMVAMETVLRAPRRVHGLALISTTPLPVPPDRHSSRRGLVEAARTVPLSHFVRKQLWTEYGGAPGDTLTLPLLEQMAGDLGHAVFASQTEMALRRSDYRERLRAVCCPALIVAGENDPLCPPEAQAHLSNAMPHATVVLLPAAGHFALVEQPDEVGRAVAAWLHTFTATQPNGSARARTSNMEME